MLTIIHCGAGGRCISYSATRGGLRGASTRTGHKPTRAVRVRLTLSYASTMEMPLDPACSTQYSKGVATARELEVNTARGAPAGQGWGTGRLHSRGSQVGTVALG